MYLLLSNRNRIRKQDENSEPKKQSERSSDFISNGCEHVLEHLATSFSELFMALLIDAM